MIFAKQRTELEKLLIKKKIRDVQVPQKNQLNFRKVHYSIKINVPVIHVLSLVEHFWKYFSLLNWIKTKGQTVSN